MEGSEMLAQGLVLGKIVLAAVLGGVMGYERALAQKPAGIRTHMLVALSAALLIILGAEITKDYQAMFPENRVVSDPIRIFQAIIIGISFVGGGVILKNSQEGKVENLTTAATLLLAATIGIVAALERWILAVGVVALFLVITYGLVGWENKQRKKTTPGEK